MNRKLIELSVTYHALNDALAMITQALAEQDSSAWDQITQLMMDRTSTLSREIVSAHATCAEEIAYKASVALDWLDADNPDLAEELAISLCRDLLRVFPVVDRNAVRVDESVSGRANLSGSFQ